MLHVQELLPRLHNLHTLGFSRKGHGNLSRLPFHALAQCLALRVLELADQISLTSPGTFEEALKQLEESCLDLLKFYGSRWLRRTVCILSSS